MPLIQLNQITKSYGNRTVFSNFSLSVGAGEFIGIMGQSGCGKSTLLNIIGLLEPFDSGELIIDGQRNIRPNSTLSNRILREKICYLFQNFALIDDETVEYNLRLAQKYAKGSRREKNLKIGEALRSVGMEDFEKSKIYELSGGEQQRISIARILLKPCKIILADEPTGSLDEKNKDVVMNLLKMFNEQGKTIVLVTHDRYVAGYCSRRVEL